MSVLLLIITMIIIIIMTAMIMLMIALPTPVARAHPDQSLDLRGAAIIYFATGIPKEQQISKTPIVLKLFVKAKATHTHDVSHVHVPFGQ